MRIPWKISFALIGLLGVAWFAATLTPSLSPHPSFLSGTRQQSANGRLPSGRPQAPERPRFQVQVG